MSCAKNEVQRCAKFVCFALAWTGWNVIESTQKKWCFHSRRITGRSDVTSLVGSGCKKSCSICSSFSYWNCVRQIFTNLTEVDGFTVWQTVSRCYWIPNSSCFLRFCAKIGREAFANGIAILISPAFQGPSVLDLLPKPGRHLIPCMIEFSELLNSCWEKLIRGHLSWHSDVFLSRTFILL